MSRFCFAAAGLAEVHGFCTAGIATSHVGPKSEQQVCVTQPTLSLVDWARELRLSWAVKLTMKGTVEAEV